jgi:hypothetical protein
MTRYIIAASADAAHRAYSNLGDKAGFSTRAAAEAWMNDVYPQPCRYCVWAVDTTQMSTRDLPRASSAGAMGVL